VGENLDRQGQLRALSRNRAACARGELEFSIPSALGTALVIPAGTVCSTTGLQRFETLAEGVIEAGQTSVRIPARAQLPGEGGNVAADTVTVLTLAPTGVTAVRNPAPFTGGAEAEDDETFRARILQTYSQLPNGANAAWYRMRALDHDGVVAAHITPRVNGIGTVGVVIASEQGVPDEALLQRVRADLQSAREIAVDVTVSAPGVTNVAVAATLRPVEGASFAQAAQASEQAIAALFGGRNLGRSLYRAQIIAAALSTGLVENFTLTSPAADVAVQKTGLALLSDINLTEEA